MAVELDSSLEGIDRAQAKADLAADDFDNGRSPTALRRSFERSQHVAFAPQPDFMSTLVGRRLDNEANR